MTTAVHPPDEHKHFLITADLLYESLYVCFMAIANISVVTECTTK